MLHGTYTVPRPIRAIVLQRGNTRDVIGTYWANLVVISDRFRRLLIESELHGWTTYAVRIEGDEQPKTPLWVIGATGRCGPVYGTDGIHLKGLPSLGQFINPDYWDGSDVFIPDNRNTILLGPRAVTSLAIAELANLGLEPPGLEPIPPDL